MNVMPRSSIIIPVHNRRSVTLACLEHLALTGVSAWAEVIVVDDGSSDGTSEAIAAAYPHVILLKGDGSLWWSGATDLGMRAAMDRGADVIFWLNDDCHARPGALALMRDQTPSLPDAGPHFDRCRSGGRESKSLAATCR
jgi:GT2 family glycosyltransferase